MGIVKYDTSTILIVSISLLVLRFRLPVTNNIESCCFTADAMKDYIAEYHTFLADAKWNWKLASTTRLDMDRAWTRLTRLDFWAVEQSDNIGRTYVFRFEDCDFGQQQRIQFGNPAEILTDGKKFRDGDLWYCFREEPDCVLVFELFYLETITGKTGFVLYGTHKWVPSNAHDWKLTISNLLAVHYFHHQPGSSKVYEK